MKFGNPLGSKEVWISQTYHGTSNTAIDIGSVSAGQAVYALADGKITNRGSSDGSYCAQSVDNSEIKIWYVHTYNWVANGTRVKKGDKICEIAPTSKNGGYAVHLHLGLTPKSEYYIMDYFDRSIVFKTKYSDIKTSWFSGDNLDWSKFKDLSYSPDLVGKKLKMLQDMNIRETANGSVIGTAKKGSICSVSKYDSTKCGYDWYLCKWVNTSAYLADTNFNEVTQDDITNLDGSKPVSEVDALKAEIERLELIIEDQKNDLNALSESNEELKKYKEWYDGFSIYVTTKEP